jgi:hypothetical protein
MGTSLSLPPLLPGLLFFFALPPLPSPLWARLRSAASSPLPLQPSPGRRGRGREEKEKEGEGRERADKKGNMWDLHVSGSYNFFCVIDKWVKHIFFSFSTT